MKVVSGAPPPLGRAVHLSGLAHGVSQELLLELLVQEDQTVLVDGPSGKLEALFSELPVVTAAATAAASCLDLNVKPNCWIKAGGVSRRHTVANYRRPLEANW